VAALILCDLVEDGRSPCRLDGGEIDAVTRAFLQWYRKCLAASAKELIVKLNGRAEALATILPEAARIIRAVAVEAGATQPEACGV
jgi:hypothetical protein